MGARFLRVAAGDCTAKEDGGVESLGENVKLLRHESCQLVPIVCQVVQDLGHCRLHGLECFVPLPEGMFAEKLPQTFDQVQVG